MKMLMIAVISTTLLAGSAQAHQGVDPCTDPELHAPNSWLLSINNGNESSRQDLLDSLALFAAGGFSVDGVFAYDFTHEITFVVSFDHSYYSQTGLAETVKQETLEAFLAIPGNQLSCNNIMRIAPGIGVRN